MLMESKYASNPVQKNMTSMFWGFAGLREN